MLLCDTGADPGRERSYFDLLRRRRADGAICLDPATVQQALAEESGALPWVACCEFDPAVGVPYVGIDNYRAAGDAVRHLLAQGHRRIGLIIPMSPTFTRGSVSKAISTLCARPALPLTSAGA